MKKTAILFFIFIITGSFFAQEMPVPVKLQVALFKKVFEYDNQLSEPKVIILYSNTTSVVKDELVLAFKDAGIMATALKEDQLGASLPEKNIIYSVPGVAPPKNLCIKSKCLSISGVVSNVEKGLVSIGLGIEDGKPKIHVNLKQLKAEGHELHPTLLKIATVYN